MRKPYKYKIGQVVNDTLRILEQIRMKDREYTQKGYLVQSLTYPTAPPYKIEEKNITRGYGCAYTSGKRVCEENSLYSVKEIRNNLINIDESKKITKGSSKKILIKCENCNSTTDMAPCVLVSRSYCCVNCSQGTSYPEKFFNSYLKEFKINHNYQVKFDDFEGRIFDYQVKINGKEFLIETHGQQHYNKDSIWYERTYDSDIEKRKYCKENNIRLIELDCRKSTFEFIKNSINKCEYLPNIKEENESSILNRIRENNSYDTELIISLYKKGMSAEKISKELKTISRSVVADILRKNNIETRTGGSCKIFCVELDKTFNSMTEAAIYVGVTKSSISNCCNGRSKTSGGYHWELYKD